MKILSDSQLYPSYKPLFSPPSSHVFPNFPIITPASFLPAPKENDETEEMTETKTDQEEAAESAEDASEMTNTKSNNDANVPAHREAMNQILKKLALKSQENLRKSKEENCRNGSTAEVNNKGGGNINEDEKLKEMIYFMYNYVQQKE